MGFLPWFGNGSLRRTRRRARSRSLSSRRPKRAHLSVEQLEDRLVPSGGLGDTLYVGDGGNDTVQQFDAATGDALSTIVARSKSLHGPRGVILDSDGHLL